MTTALRSTITAYFLRTPRTVCICSAHLDWKQYALNLVCGYDGNSFKKMPGGPVTDVRQLQMMDDASSRGQALWDFVNHAVQLGGGMPIILAGDLNEGSHLDWTEATKDLYGHNGVVIPWRHSKILER